MMANNVVCFQRPTLQRQGGKRNFTAIDCDEQCKLSDSTASTYADSNVDDDAGSGTSNTDVVVNLPQHLMRAATTATTLATSDSSVDISSSSSSSGDGIGFIRNKVKYEQGVQKLREMQSRLGRNTQVATTAEHTEIVTHAEDLFDLLSSLNDTNDLNETTMQHLQRHLAVLTNERDSARQTTDKFTKLMANHRTGLEEELHKERKGFSDVCNKNKQEIHEWRHKVHKLGKKCKHLEHKLKEGVDTQENQEAFADILIGGWKEKVSGLEQELKEKDAVIQRQMIQLCEARAMADTTAMSSIVAAVELDDTLKDIHQRGASSLPLKSQGTISSDESDSKSDVDAEEEEEMSDSEIRARAEKLLHCASVASQRQPQLGAEGMYPPSKQHSSSPIPQYMGLSYYDDSARTQIQQLKKLNGELVEENGQLIIKCQQLEVETMPTSKAEITLAEEEVPTTEISKDDKSTTTTMKIKEALAMIKELQAENESLHQAMEEEMQHTHGIHERMASFAEAHQESVREYEEKLARMKEEIDVLRAAMAEDTEADYYEQMLFELQAEKEEAHQTCTGLQKQIYMLTGHHESSHFMSVEESTRDIEFCELEKADERLASGERTYDMFRGHDKSSDSLSEEDSTIKENECAELGCLNCDSEQSFAQSTTEPPKVDRTMPPRTDVNVYSIDDEVQFFHQSVAIDASNLSQSGFYDRSGALDHIAIVSGVERHPWRKNGTVGLEDY